MDRLRLIIADCNDDTRIQIVALLGSDYEIVGGVVNGEQLVRAATSLLPDVIVSEIAMPRLDGPSKRDELIALKIPVPFVFITEHSMETTSHLIQKECAFAFVHKADLAMHLRSAVDAVHNNRNYYSPFYLGRRGLC